MRELLNKPDDITGPSAVHDRLARSGNPAAYAEALYECAAEIAAVFEAARLDAPPRHSVYPEAAAAARDIAMYAGGFPASKDKNFPDRGGELLEALAGPALAAAIAVPDFIKGNYAFRRKLQNGFRKEMIRLNRLASNMN